MKEIFIEILAHYKEAVKVVENIYGMNAIRQQLMVLGVDFGVCSCAARLGIHNHLYQDETVELYVTTTGGYWCAVPIHQEDKIGVIGALDDRIIILTKIINEWQS